VQAEVGASLARQFLPKAIGRRHSPDADIQKNSGFSPENGQSKIGPLLAR
jgi:hypothetical protein